MSICRCGTHDKNWDSDFHEECPGCKDAYISLIVERTKLREKLEEISNKIKKMHESMFS